MKTIEEIQYQIENIMSAVFWYNIKLPQKTKEFLKEVASWKTESDVDITMFFEFENLCFDILQVIQGKERKIIKIEN